MLPYEAATWAFSKMLSFFELRILKRYQNEHLYYRSVAQYHDLDIDVNDITKTAP